jgi:transcriptional regulator with XRE-family HTH domain
MPELRIQRPLVGEFLLQQRHKLKKTQKELASAAKIPAHRLGRMECGRDPIPEKSIPVLAATYEIPEDELRTLLERQKAQNGSDLIEDFVITGEELAYLSQLEPHLGGQLTVGFLITLIKRFRESKDLSLRRKNGH